MCTHIGDNLAFLRRHLLNTYVKEPAQPAQACIIWMHGLGADAQDMVGLAEHLDLDVAVRHVFIDAPVRPVTLNNGMPMRAWYDIFGMQLTNREDREGVLQSDDMVRQVIASQLADGFSDGQIFLAGFSQGGAMALFTGLRTETRLGGIIALSSYLPLAEECQLVQDKNTPIFLAGGQFDTMVLPLWTQKTVSHLRAQGFQQITAHEYPMAHAVCAEEMQDLAQWLRLQVSAIITTDEGMS